MTWLAIYTVELELASRLIKEVPFWKHGRPTGITVLMAIAVGEEYEMKEERPGSLKRGGGPLVVLL